MALAEWEYDPNPDTASLLSDLPVRLVIGIPYTRENAALFAALGPEARFVLRQNTGGALHFAFAAKEKVRRSDTTHFRQVAPGLVLVLIGERAGDDLPTGDRWIITARYLAAQELAREGVVLAGDTLPTLPATAPPPPTVTPVPQDPRAHLHVALISVQHSRDQAVLVVRLRPGE